MERETGRGENLEIKDDAGYQQFVDDAIRYLSPDMKEEERKAFEEKLKQEIKKGFILNIFSIPVSEVKETGFDNIYRKIIESYLERKNPGTQIYDVERGKPFTKEGKILFENEFAKIQVNDPDGVLEKNEGLRSLIEMIESEAKNFITPIGSLFKAIIVVDNDSISIRMDPGHHKEFLGIAFPGGDKTKGVLVYKHTPSGRERRGSSKTYRAEYIQQITGGEINTETGEVFSAQFVGDQEQLHREFGGYLRLCQSVKDLDLNLEKKDVSFAVKMFFGGVTNMDRFLGLCKTPEMLQKQMGAIKDKKIVNEREAELLEEYIKYLDGLDDFKRSLEIIKQAKDLNYEIISDLSKLGDGARFFLSISEPSPKRADEFVQTYQAIIDKIIKMEKAAKIIGGLAESSVKEINVKKLTDQLHRNVEEMANIARFGYGTPDVLRHEDGTVDVSEEGKKRLPELARTAYDKFTKIFEDKGDKVQSWPDVGSLEEAVRFFHRMVVEKSALVWMTLIARNKTQSEFFRDSGDGLDSVRIIDFVGKDDKKNEMKRVTMAALKGLGRKRFREVFVGESEYDNSTIIFSEDYLNIAVPVGKHYIEMASQIYESGENKEFTISLRYVESGYKGAAERKNLSTALLRRLGFRVEMEAGRSDISRGMLYANFKTGDKKTWHNTLADTIRFIAALKDLDLMKSQGDEVDLFEEGVVSLFWNFRKLKESMKGGEINEDAKHAVSVIMGIGSDSEKSFLMRLLSDETKIFKKDFLPYLGSLDIDGLDEVVTSLMHLEDEAKKRKDKKAAGKFHRIGDKVIELISELEKQKSVH